MGSSGERAMSLHHMMNFKPNDFVGARMALSEEQKVIGNKDPNATISRAYREKLRTMLSLVQRLCGKHKFSFEATADRIADFSEKSLIPLRPVAQNVVAARVDH
jgi:hypothetical protein